MHKNEFENAITFEEAVENIKKITGVEFKWYPVKNKYNQVFEVSGGLIFGKLVLRIHVPTYKEEFYLNGYMKINYTVSTTDTDNTNDITLPLKKMSDFINKDHSTYLPKKEKVIDYVETHYKTKWTL